MLQSEVEYLINLFLRAGIVDENDAQTARNLVTADVYQEQNVFPSRTVVGVK